MKKSEGCRVNRITRLNKSRILKDRDKKLIRNKKLLKERENLKIYRKILWWTEKKSARWQRMNNYIEKWIAYRTKSRSRKVNETSKIRRTSKCRSSGSRISRAKSISKTLYKRNKLNRKLTSLTSNKRKEVYLLKTKPPSGIFQIKKTRTSRIRIAKSILVSLSNIKSKMKMKLTMNMTSWSIDAQKLLKNKEVSKIVWCNQKMHREFRKSRANNQKGSKSNNRKEH